MRALILAAAVAVLTGTPAIAQQSPQQPMMGGQMPGAMMEHGGMGHMMMGHMMMDQGMMDGGMPMMGMNPSQHVEGRLAFLKTELKITEAQAAPWNAYADAVRANAKRMGELMDQMMSGGMPMTGQPAMMSLPDRLGWAERHMAAHMEMLAAIKEPAMQLYGALSDEQKRLADQLIGPMGMM